MSDDEQDIDVESDDELGYDSAATQYMTQAEKRAHHNALERKRRDHIKDSFHNLRDSVPTLQGEKSSRAQILKQATEYISFMNKKNSLHKSNIDDLKRQNQVLEQQVHALEKTKAAGQYVDGGVEALDGYEVPVDDGLYLNGDVSDDDNSDTDAADHNPHKRRKLVHVTSHSGSDS